DSSAPLSAAALVFFRREGRWPSAAVAATTLGGEVSYAVALAWRIAMFRTLLAGLGLAVCLVAVSSAQDTAPADSAVKPADRLKQPGWKKRHEAFVTRAKKGDVDVLFLGDSITQGWENFGKKAWAEHFEPLKAANFGIGGDRTEHVLWRITEGKE